MDHAKYYFDSIHFGEGSHPPLMRAEGILFYGLVKHAGAIDLHPRDLLSEKVDRQCLGKCQPCAACLRPSAQPGSGAGVSTNLAVTVIRACHKVDHPWVICSLANRAECRHRGLDFPQSLTTSTGRREGRARLENPMPRSRRWRADAEGGSCSLVTAFSSARRASSASSSCRAWAGSPKRTFDQHQEAGIADGAGGD